jgi:GGDEF domain-containing protein
MGLREAKRYISELRKKQDNPYLWPDFLTGLPDRTAIIEKTSKVFPKLGRYAVSYIRIANIHPYLIKYGTDRHAEIIQWAAAVLKITADKYKGFVGTFNIHDFVAICEAKKTKDFLAEASQLFEKKAKTFYSKEDLKKKKVLSFLLEGKKIDIGFMKLVAATLDEKPDMPKEQLIPYLGRLCAEFEKV